MGCTKVSFNSLGSNPWAVPMHHSIHWVPIHAMYQCIIQFTRFQSMGCTKVSFNSLGFCPLGISMHPSIHWVPVQLVYQFIIHFTYSFTHWFPMHEVLQCIIQFTGFQFMGCYNGSFNSPYFNPCYSVSFNSLGSNPWVVPMYHSIYWIPMHGFSCLLLFNGRPLVMKAFSGVITSCTHNCSTVRLDKPHLQTQIWTL